MIPRVRRAAALGWLLLLTATGARADNLIANGGFETGDLTGYSYSGNLVGVGGTNAAAPYGPATGNYNAYIGTVGALGTISQVFADEVGVPLTISYQLADPQGGSPSQFTSQFDGATLSSLVNSAAFGYTTYSFDVTGTGSDTLSFAASNSPSFFEIDDVNAVEDGAIADAPEPGVWGLLIVGIAIMGAALRYSPRRPSKGSKPSFGVVA